MRHGIDPEDVDNQMAMIIGLTEAATQGDAKAVKVIADLLGDTANNSGDAIEDDPITKSLSITYLGKNFDMVYSRSTHQLIVSRGKNQKPFYVFARKDESSCMLIQGITLAGILLDEVAFMPRSFVEQALAQCSVSNARFWFNCNPDVPEHWFNKEWVKMPPPTMRSIKLHGRQRQRGSHQPDA